MTCHDCGMPSHPDPDALLACLQDREAVIGTASNELDLAYLREARGSAGMVAIYRENDWIDDVRITLRRGLSRDKRLRALGAAHDMLSNPHAHRWDLGRTEGAEHADAWIGRLVVSPAPVHPIEVRALDGDREP